MSIVLVGVNHKSAPVEVRERLALTEEACASGLRNLVDGDVVREGLIVSTCNRVEVYGAAETSVTTEEITRCLARKIDNEMPADRQLRFRIAVAMGDVVTDGDLIYGQGVDTASRLESLAEPGGVNVSRAVRDQVRDRLPISFEDLGERQVKNIARPIRVFRVRGCTALNAERLSASPQPLPLPDKPSLAVQPFENMSSDPEQEYREAVQFYKHDIDWTNRLILGDSLHVMASLARREDLHRLPSVSERLDKFYKSRIC